jgi:hypothetical protein
MSLFIKLMALEIKSKNTLQLKMEWNKVSLKLAKNLG